jgi:hypothetical protein
VRGRGRRVGDEYGEGSGGRGGSEWKITHMCGFLTGFLTLICVKQPRILSLFALKIAFSWCFRSL